MIFLMSRILLLEDSCCELMLKREVKNYFRKFTKTLSICFQCNTPHRDLAMRKYNLLEQINILAKHGILSDKFIRFI